MEAKARKANEAMTAARVHQGAKKMRVDPSGRPRANDAAPSPKSPTLDLAAAKLAALEPATPEVGWGTGATDVLCSAYGD